MSEVPNFVTRRPLPFCIPEVDLEAIDWGAQAPELFYIKDLTFKDAWDLWWKLESVSLAFAVSGVKFAGNGGLAEVSADFEGTLERDLPPRKRVCNNYWKRLAWQGTGAEAEAIDHSEEDAYDPPVDTIEHRDITLQWTPGASIDADDNLFITKQPTEVGEGYPKYTFWLTMFRNTHFIDLCGRGEDLTGYQTKVGSPFDVTVLSGTMPVWLMARDGPTLPNLYNSGGTIDAFTLTPNFYTFPA
jgi:hypothetical protein